MNAPVVVTGGASGLGRVIADALLGVGRAVVLVDRDEDALLASPTGLGGNEARVAHVVADLSSTDGVRAAAVEISRNGPLGGLVNNAGGWAPGEQYPHASPERWMHALTLNLIAPMLLTQMLWDDLVTGGGAVVNVGSSGGLSDDAYGSPEYGAAKAGLRRFTSSLGDRTDLRVMAVVPGWIGLDRAVTERAEMNPSQRAETSELVPPELIADTVLDLIDRGSAGQIVELLG